MEPAERQAIAACQTGDLTNFTTLYELYVDKIYRFVYFKTFHQQTAEDLVSVVFMKALENIAKYDVVKGNFSSWLYRIAQNTVIDHYRTTKSTVNLDEMFDLASKQNVVSEVEASLALQEVKDYLTSLDSDTRDLLIMRLWQGLSYQEIAELTGKSEGALKMATSRALKTLRSSISAAAWLLLLASFS